MAAVNVFPAPLQDLTATLRLAEIASRISDCLAQGSTPRMCLANLLGLLRNSRWLSSRSSLGGVGLRAATDRLRFLGLVPASAGMTESGLATSKYGFLRAAGLV